MTPVHCRVGETQSQISWCHPVDPVHLSIGEHERTIVVGNPHMHEHIDLVVAESCASELQQRSLDAQFLAEFSRCGTVEVFANFDNATRREVPPPRPERLRFGSAVDQQSPASGIEDQDGATPMQQVGSAHLRSQGRSDNHVMLVDDGYQCLAVHRSTLRSSDVSPVSDLSDQAPEPVHRTMLSGGRLDRQHDRRTDNAWIETNRGTSGVVHLVWQGQVVVSGTVPAVLPADRAPDPHLHVFLGELDGELHWTVDVSHHERQHVEDMLPSDAAIVALRDAGALLPLDDANVLAFAAGMGYWHQTHQFCGSCGSVTRVSAGGHERVCDACKQVHWPRTDPAVIMLVIDQANDQALLGRQKIWPPKMYSTLAGFVEPGESLEDAVARETFEEAGVRVGKVRYWCSQPWPFPRSVMLGFHAEYRSGDVVPHPTEMDDVRWFTREELLDTRLMGNRGNPMIPPLVTISRVLLDAWLDERVQF